MSVYQTGIEPLARSRSNTEQSLDLIFIWATRLCAFSIAGILCFIALEVGHQALPAIQAFGLGFVFQQDWDPVKNIYGVFPMIYGTLITSLIGLLLAVPIGVGTAIFLSENFLPLPVRTTLVFLVELLAAIPSVVYGLWGIFVLIPFVTNPLGHWLYKNLGWFPLFGTDAAGPGLFPAGIVVTIMILP
ncbi:MAG: hypothetical protein WCD18_12260, partial [Thermosynechococcaceae cyanobacterium]